MSTARAVPAAPRLWVHVIGPMQAFDFQGVSVLPRSRKARAVLAILALASPQPVSRARITNLLWSTREREQARGSLRQCVHEIQGLLQPLGPGVLDAERDQLRLDQDLVWLDLRETTASPGSNLLEDLGSLDPAFDDWLKREQSRHFPSAAAPPASADARNTERGIRVGIRSIRAIGDHAAVLADGLGEELAVALSRFRWFAAVPPSALVQNQADMDADYLLDGAVRQMGRQIRATLRIQDMRSAGAVVWARHFDGDVDDLAGLLDRIVGQTAAQADSELLVREGNLAASKGGGSATALALAAVPGLFRLEPEAFSRSGTLLAEAVRLDPESAFAHAWCAYWHVMAMGQGWEATTPHSLETATTLADRAIMLDGADARALSIAGHVRGFLGKQVAEALMLHNRALALNSSLASAWMLSGLARCYRGDHAEAIRHIETARSLSPFDPHAFFFDVSLMLPHLMLGEYERAIEFGRMTAQLNPNFSSSWKGLLVALGHLRRADEAARVRERLELLEPGFSIRAAVKRSPLQRAEDRERYAEGMRLGGLPE